MPVAPTTLKVPQGRWRGPNKVRPATPPRPAPAAPPTRHAATPAAPVPGQTPRPPGASAPAPWRGGAYAGARPQGFVVPQFVTGANEDERWKNYLIYLQQHPEAPGNRILHNMTGFQQDSGYQPKTPAAPPPGPGTPGAPGTHTAPTPGPPVGGGLPTPAPSVSTPDAWGGPPPGFPPGTGLAGGLPAPQSFNDPFSPFLAAIPAMRANTQRQLAQGMSDAGFTGNRWGTSAMERAGQIGAESAMRENAMLSDLLYQTGQQSENRALQGTGMGMQFGSLMDQLAQSRFLAPAQLAQYEQGRQDDFSKMAFGDWGANRLGWLGALLPYAAGQHGASPGQIYTTTEPGKPGAVDWLTLLGNLFS